jgi:Exopolysaccharide biosynthesis protein YbjH
MAQASAYTDASAVPSAARGLPHRCESESSKDGVRAETAGRAIHLLAAHGFANVAALADGACLVVAYENARYRDNRRALREAAALLTPLLHRDADLVLVPTYRGIPLVTAVYAGPKTDPGASPSAPNQKRASPTVSLDVTTVPDNLFLEPRASSSFGRVDVVVHPWFQAVFGDFDNPVASRTGVAPELRIDLHRGLSVSAQVLLTLQDDLPTGESRVRPGRVTVNQLIRLPHDVFVSATAGIFNPDRYGADVEARAWFANGRLSAGVELGLTGAAIYDQDGWYRTPVRDRTALADVSWRVMPYDLLLRITGGAFLEDERGVRLDVSRRFGEVEIGWFLLTSEEGENGGVLLRLPLLPRTYGRPRPVRLRPAETYRWQYQYHGFVPAGWGYDTGNRLNAADDHLGLPRLVTVQNPL